MIVILLHQLRHVNIDSDNSKSGDFNVNNKAQNLQCKTQENADLRALLDKNSTQSALELDRGLNVNGIIVKRLHDMQSIHKKGKWVPH